MDTPENLLRSHRKRVISALLKGKESVTQLQTLIHNSSRGPHSVHDELTLQILRSFTEALFQLKNCGPRLILSDCAVSGRRKSKEPAKARRGCYKRRKCCDSRITVSETMEDDHAWRKYGQKKILNSKYPRCYFRCTHKNSQGCKAIKQVQRISEDEYNITYFGRHTCKDSIIRAPVLVIKSSSSISAAHSQSSECSTQEDATLPVDDSCFANLDNLFRWEEMRLLDI